MLLRCEMMFYNAGGLSTPAHYLVEVPWLVCYYQIVPLLKLVFRLKLNLPSTNSFIQAF
jgi:hypothetical protein